MPHLIVEYSENLARVVDIDALLESLHGAALATGTAALDALRTRAEPRANYVIADRHPDNAYLAITARLAPGRSAEEKHRFIAALVDAAERALGAAKPNVMLSVEWQEVDPEFRVNKNWLRETIAARTQPPTV